MLRHLKVLSAYLLMVVSLSQCVEPCTECPDPTVNVIDSVVVRDSIVIIPVYKTITKIVTKTVYDTIIEPIYEYETIVETIYEYKDTTIVHNDNTECIKWLASAQVGADPVTDVVFIYDCDSTVKELVNLKPRKVKKFVKQNDVDRMFALVE